MDQGLKDILQKLREQPSNILLVERFIALTADLRDEKVKEELLLELADQVVHHLPRQALRIAKMVFDFDSACVRSMEIMALSMEALGRFGKAEVLRLELEKLSLAKLQGPKERQNFQTRSVITVKKLLENELPASEASWTKYLVAIDQLIADKKLLLARFQMAAALGKEEDSEFVKAVWERLLRVWDQTGMVPLKWSPTQGVETLREMLAMHHKLRLKLMCCVT